MEEWVPPTRPLTWENVRAFLPKMETADAQFKADLDNAYTGGMVAAALKQYHSVVEEGIQALHADTADRNSLTTLQSVYRHSQNFSKVLRDFMEGK